MNNWLHLQAKRSDCLAGFFPVNGAVVDLANNADTLIHSASGATVSDEKIGSPLSASVFSSNANQLHDKYLTGFTLIAKMVADSGVAGYQTFGWNVAGGVNPYPLSVEAAITNDVKYGYICRYIYERVKTTAFTINTYADVRSLQLSSTTPTTHAITLDYDEENQLVVLKSYLNGVLLNARTTSQATRPLMNHGVDYALGANLPAGFYMYWGLAFNKAMSLDEIKCFK